MTYSKHGVLLNLLGVALHLRFRQNLEACICSHRKISPKEKFITGSLITWNLRNYAGGVPIRLRVI
jgi:hypothetical protein